MEKNEWSNQVIIIRCGLGDVVYNDGAHRAGNVHLFAQLTNQIDLPLKMQHVPFRSVSLQ